MANSNKQDITSARISNDAGAANNQQYREPGSNIMTRRDLEMMLAHRVFRWNQMHRFVQPPKDGISLRASSHTSSPVPIPTSEEALAAYKWWIVDQVFWYMHECVTSMGIGVHVDILYSMADTDSSIKHENNKLVITLSRHLLFISYTPACYTFADDDEAFGFYKDVVDEIYRLLDAGGFDIQAREMNDTVLEASGVVREGMRDMGRVRLTIRWASDEYADALEKLFDVSQLDALDAGVPLEDIVA